MENKVLRLGVNYSSRVYMSKFDAYKNLFAEQGDFDIPSNWAVGVAYQADKKTTLNQDIYDICFINLLLHLQSFPE